MKGTMKIASVWDGRNVIVVGRDGATLYGGAVNLPPMTGRTSSDPVLEVLSTGLVLLTVTGADGHSRWKCTLTDGVQGAWTRVETPPPVAYPRRPDGGTPFGWNVVSTMPEARISDWAEGTVKVFAFVLAEPVKGFQVDFYPMSDMDITGEFWLAPKPDSTDYSTDYGVGNGPYAVVKGGYDSCLRIPAFSQAYAGCVRSPLIYPGVYYLRLTCMRAGAAGGHFGFLNAQLIP